MPFCPRCGKEVNEDMNVCPYCGYQLKGVPATQRVPTSTVSYGTKNPGIGAILSIIPGLGQIYAGRLVRGLLFLILGIPIATVLAVLFWWTIITLFLPFAFWVWNIFDAYNLCLQYNRQLSETGKPPW
jgi:TM2 domain-containing membrane protein YozV